MKVIQEPTYVCEHCGNKSRNFDKIANCEHRGDLWNIYKDDIKPFNWHILSNGIQNLMLFPYKIQYKKCPTFHTWPGSFCEDNQIIMHDVNTTQTVDILSWNVARSFSMEDGYNKFGWIPDPLEEFVDFVSDEFIRAFYKLFHAKQIKWRS